LHLSLAILVILASIRWGDWKNLKQYYPTMLYVALANCLYKCFAHKYFHLWEEIPDFIINDKLSVFILHAFIINPFSAFLFLSNYPDSKIRQFLHTLKWIVIFIVIEWVAIMNGSIKHYNGWSMGWSIFFVVIMFSFIRLHYVKPFLALLLSVCTTLFYIFVFYL
jgi:hypothetical protein